MHFIQRKLFSKEHIDTKMIMYMYIQGRIGLGYVGGKGRWGCESPDLRACAFKYQLHAESLSMRIDRNLGINAFCLDLMRVMLPFSRYWLT